MRSTTCINRRCSCPWANRIRIAALPSVAFGGNADITECLLYMTQRGHWLAVLRRQA